MAVTEIGSQLPFSTLGLLDRAVDCPGVESGGGARGTDSPFSTLRLLDNAIDCRGVESGGRQSRART
ncbi:hypothetical protein [Mycolicibacterium fortuitum]|uniref:hypothetical protein n=1 Tax=Mycolicibacterium fortuitum TaxID=1766 RepID=UPI000A6EA0E6|nr:hypothetical protein [Mycolicibacterium fortuitum]